MCCIHQPLHIFVYLAWHLLCPVFVHMLKRGNDLLMIEHQNEDTEMPAELPDHNFFKCDRWIGIACSDSYYFDGQTCSKMKFDNISDTWKANIGANLKDQCSEIKKFMGWLAPHICIFGFVGYTRYEEFYNPTLICIKDGEAIFKQIDVKKPERGET